MENLREDFQAISHNFYTQERETKEKLRKLIDSFFTATNGADIDVEALVAAANEQGEELEFEIAFNDDEANGTVDRPVVKLTDRGAESESDGSIDYAYMDVYQLLEVVSFLASLEKVEEGE